MFEKKLQHINTKKVEDKIALKLTFSILLIFSILYICVSKYNKHMKNFNNLTPLTTEYRDMVGLKLKNIIAFENKFLNKKIMFKTNIIKIFQTDTIILPDNIKCRGINKTNRNLNILNFLIPGQEVEFSGYLTKTFIDEFSGDYTLTYYDINYKKEIPDN